MLGSPTAAGACWDGYAVRTDRIAFTGGDEEWEPGRAKELATWARRFEALLGPDGTLETEFGYGEACVGTHCVSLQSSASPAALFDDVATALAVPRAQRLAALRITASPYAVQIAATRSRASAEALAERVAQLELPTGFYEAGGFPADNPEAHVVLGIDGHGQPVYRVVVGAFLDRREAVAHEAEIAQLTGLATLPREL